MPLMNHYSTQEKIVAIAFLQMIAYSDGILLDEEELIISLLADNIGVKKSDIQKLGEEKIKHTLKNITKQKTIELIRMGYSILDIDESIHIDEIKMLSYIADEHNIDLEDDHFISGTIFASKELTPLDKVVLVALAYKMVYADDFVHNEEMKILEQICKDSGINIEEFKGLNVPTEFLLQAVKTMSRPAVMRILNELIRIAISDDDFSEQEFDLIFPLLVSFNVDLEFLINQAVKRKSEASKTTE